MLTLEEVSCHVRNSENTDLRKLKIAMQRSYMHGEKEMTGQPQVVQPSQYRDHILNYEANLDFLAPEDRCGKWLKNEADKTAP